MNKQTKMTFTIIASIALTAGWNTIHNEDKKDLFDIVLDNIEALAQYENNSEKHSAYKFDSVLNKNICNGPGSSC